MPYKYMHLKCGSVARSKLILYARHCHCALFVQVVMLEKGGLEVGARK